ncbi:MAG: adenylate cyclase [Halieaceae bacterium]
MPIKTAPHKSSWAVSLPPLLSRAEILVAGHSGATNPDCAEVLEKLSQAMAKLTGLLTVESGDGAPSMHDIRNMAGAVQGYAELIHEDFGQLINSELATVIQELVAVCSCIEDLSPVATPTTGTKTPVEGGVILAVDDAEENRDLLSRYLGRDGHTVITANSGYQALEILEDTPVDLVILDLIMPEMDGDQVLQRIKARDAWRSIGVIVISGQQDREGIVRCIEAGADDYLFKPFNPVLLRARIKAGLERKRWMDREQAYREELERNHRFIRHTFGRYVSDEVVASLLEEPEGLKLGGVQREVSILMADIRKFTSLCEGLEPAEVVRMLNIYLGGMSEIILDHQGTIDEFIGDAILAIFGAPVAREDHADRAVQCALDMQQAVAAINEINAAADLPEISIGISVNTGDVIAGNIGSDKRTKYGVVGHQVNVTSRIEDHALSGEILISQSTLDAITGEIVIGRSDTVTAKGMNQPIKIYEVISLTATGGKR